MRWAGTLVALLAVTGCGDDVMMLHPIVDLPANDDDAYPLSEIDELILSVAESGHEEDIQVDQSSVDDPPSLSGVPFGDDMVLHLSGERGTVELAYGRSCMFSVPDDELGDLHIYFSLIVKWGDSGTPKVPTRTGGYAYALEEGARAVFIGGGLNVTSAELFEARSTGAFTEFPGVDIPARRGAVLAPFGDGRALLVGGIDSSDAYYDGVLLVDPTGAELQIIEGNGPPVVGHAAATLVDGTVVVAGGRGPDGVTDAAWQFSTDGGEIAPINELFPLNLARADHTMTRFGSEVGADVLVIGGRDDAGAPVDQAELFRPLSESFEIIADAPMWVPRWGHRAVRMPGGFVLVIGGYAPDPGTMADVPVAKLELYDPVQGRFTDAGDMPAGAGLNELTVSPLPDGRVLLAGGLDETGTPVSSAYFAEIDPIDGRLVVGTTADMQVPRAGHSAVQLCDGTILVVGGTDYDPELDPPAERYNPRSKDRR